MGQTIVWVSFAPVEGKALSDEPEMRNKKKGIKNCPCGGERVELVYKAHLLCGCEIDWRRGNAIKTSRPFLGYEFRFTADELPGSLTP